MRVRHTIPDDAARALVKPLARRDGIFAGTSSALNILGAIRLAQKLPPDQTVAAVAVDTGLKYLQGDLYA